MTPEDLQALRAIVREELTAVEQRLRAEMAAVEQRITHATAGNLSDLRNELVARFETFDRRLERLENQMHAINLQTAGILKSLADGDRLDSATSAALSAQQKSITELYNQIAEIKRRLTQ